MKHLNHQALNCVILLHLHSLIWSFLPLWVKKKTFNKEKVGKHARIEGLCREKSEEEIFLTILGEMSQTLIHDYVHRRPSPLRTSAMSATHSHSLFDFWHADGDPG